MSKEISIGDIENAQELLNKCSLKFVKGSIEVSEELDNVKVHVSSLLDKEMSVMVEMPLKRVDHLLRILSSSVSDLEDREDKTKLEGDFYNLGYLAGSIMAILCSMEPLIRKVVLS